MRARLHIDDESGQVQTYGPYEFEPDELQRLKDDMQHWRRFRSPNGGEYVILNDGKRDKIQILYSSVEDIETVDSSREAGTMSYRPMRERLQGIPPENVTVEKANHGECNSIPAYFLLDGEREIVILRRELSQPIVDGDIIVRYLPDSVRDRLLVRNPGFTRAFEEGPTNSFPEHYAIRAERISLVSHQPRTKEQPVSAQDERKVFVIHGRNEQLNEAMFSFLTSIGLHPMEWSELVSGTGEASPYIGEILERGFETAQAVVALLTPDDEARLREPYHKPHDPIYETELTPQPRPNVLFEAGMAFGTHSTRTVIVEIGTLRPFSDVAGRLTVRMSNATQARQALAQRLKSAGCPVNLEGTRWHTAGDFTVKEVRPTNP